MLMGGQTAGATGVKRIWGVILKLEVGVNKGALEGVIEGVKEGSGDGVEVATGRVSVLPRVVWVGNIVKDGDG